MKRAFPQSSLPQPLSVLRKAGYVHFVDPNTQEESLVLRITHDYYPRMHLYVEPHGADWSFNLHIDQKKPSYSGSAKHAGEYEGPIVEREMERLTKWVAADTGYYHPDLGGFPAPSEPVASSTSAQGATEAQTPPTPAAQVRPKRDLFGGIFG